MTDQEINIAVATACGWKFVGYGSGFDVVMDDPKGNRLFGSSYIPNYCNDLNAIHAAEMIMEPKSFNSPNYLEKYESILEMLCNKQFGFELRATARQRAEALLRALGKWKP